MVVGRAVQDVTGVTSTGSFEPEGNEVTTRDSVMVIDVDQHAIRAVLFDLVDGVPRFVGVGASLPLQSGQSIDGERVWSAIRDLEQQSGRRLATDERIISPQYANGDGVDEVFLTGLPVEVNRAAVISIGNGSLGKQLVAGIRRSPTVVAFANDDVGREGSTLTSTALLSWLRDVAPKTLILAHDGGSTEDWDIAIEAASDAARDGVITAGIVIADDEKQQLVAQSLAAALDLSGIDPLEYEPWEIATALESEFNEQYSQRIQSLDSMPALSTARYVDRMRAIQAVASFLHRRMRRNVVSLTIGSGSLVYLASNGGGVTGFRADRDLELGARSLLRIPPERITRWMPHRWSAEELTQWILNRALRPFGRADTTTDSLVESALRRELISELMSEVGMSDRSDIDLIVVGPSFADQDPGLAALTIIDGMAPKSADGVVTIALDAEGIMASVGAISTLDPVFARDVIEQDFLVPMATCVVVTGEGEPGALAVRGEIKSSDGETRRFSVPFGNVQLLNVGESEAADVTLTPEPGFAIGAHGAGETVEFVGDRKLFGGRVGIIIDARGRPIQVPDDPEARVAMLRSWLSDVGTPTD
jgi:hypothetical protein